MSRLSAVTKKVRQKCANGEDLPHFSCGSAGPSHGSALCTRMQKWQTAWTLAHFPSLPAKDPIPGMLARTCELPRSVLASPGVLACIRELPHIRCLRLQACLLALANCRTLGACASKSACLHLGIAEHWFPRHQARLLAFANCHRFHACAAPEINANAHLLFFPGRCASNIKQRGLHL